ncbi:MAG: [protein-PII] uridylyltransferase [Ghiorsea sp.]
MSHNQAELVTYGKETLEHLTEEVSKAFSKGEKGTQLVRMMCKGVDELLIHIWQAVATNPENAIDVVAVGGYGRGELAPQSDWDVWFLTPEVVTEQMNEDIQSFLYVMWDMNAKIGHAVRSSKETITHIKEDWSSATAAQEMRLLSGKGENFDDLTQKTKTFFHKKRKKFVEAKILEHEARHQRTGNSAFMMEPDIKECKGGLRDVQSIFWIAKAWYGVQSITGLEQDGYLSTRERKHLISARGFLWRCRTGLHLETKRPNDRLSFEQQASLAEAMGYKSKEHLPAVDGLMKDYFRHAGRIARVSGMLLDDIQEQLNPPLLQWTKNLDQHFTLSGNIVDIQHENVFKEDPLNLLRVFHVGQQDHRHLSSSTLRQIREDARLINDNFRRNPEAHQLFIRIMRFPRNVAWALKEMNDTAVLGRFIPAFRHIVGLGQFNQYHAYTVDEHTIKAVGEARNMMHDDREARLPLAQEVIHRLKRPDLLYMALIFHDIAKGMAGDHSKNGEVLAREFCLSIGINEDGAEMVAWLVRKHLTMAVTSQRFDLSDPEVIQTFADKVGSMERLNCLLCLSVADISAVGPNVWNDWKGSLLSELYHATRQALMGEQVNPQILLKQKEERIKNTLKFSGDPSLEDTLNTLPQRCIAHFPPNQLQPIAKLISESDLFSKKDANTVGYYIDHDRCDTMIMVAATEKRALFAKLAAVIAAGHINVVAAHAFSLEQGKVLDVFHIQNNDKEALSEQCDLDRLVARIQNMLDDDSPLSEPKSTTTRTNILMERVSARVRTLPLASFQQTAIEVTAADRPGLLAELAYQITSMGFDIQAASISSFGERIVDVFFIQSDGELLTEDEIKKLFLSLKEIASLENDA